MNYYIKDNFYFDIDKLNQLRISGPQNHLLCGITFPENVRVQIKSYDVVNNRLEVLIKLSASEISTAIPIVTDIRTLRNYTEMKNPEPTYKDLVMEGMVDLIPHIIKKSKIKGNNSIKFLTTYEDVDGKVRRYGVKLIFPKGYKTQITDRTLDIKARGPIKMRIIGISMVAPVRKIQKAIFKDNEIPFELLPNKRLIFLYKISGANIEHLIRAQKTSSFEYGTIFPRDWIESADLGAEDFSPEALDYIYNQAMKYVSEIGEGWHEEVVGSYKTKVGEGGYVDRKMIDIEPRYIMGLNIVSKKFLLRVKNRTKLRLVANFILSKAFDHDLITFKRIEERFDKYFLIGNWRDSTNAYKNQKSPLAPYDVNCVFYPTALKIIRQYSKFFKIKNLDWIDYLIEKWEGNKYKFRLLLPDNLVGYAIALHGIKKEILQVSHLDESYDLFYGNPTLEEVVSFAKKLVDPGYFYTPVGPILVAKTDNFYNTSQYHGRVIWPKQAAFAIAGLYRMYKKGQSESWPPDILRIIKQSIIKTSEACFRGWKQLGLIPELYYWDSSEKRARLYTDQRVHEGPMSTIQLWSAVGARRIMRDYTEIIGEKDGLKI